MRWLLRGPAGSPNRGTVANPPTRGQDAGALFASFGRRFHRGFRGRLRHGRSFDL